MRRNMNRIVALGMSSVLMASMLTGSLEYASHSYAVDAKAAGRVVTAEKVDTKENATMEDEGVLSKQETVYVNLDASGKLSDVVVSDWLKNSGTNGKLEDVSDLKDIENVKGDEKFSQDGKKLTWQTGSDDIYYQGKTEKELPVGMEITYELDGKEVEPEEILGKSGKLKITIRYINHSKKTVSINGKETELYTPFMMVTGTMFPVESFKNITIDHGTVVSEGDNHIVVAYGVPGLKESLDLDNLDLGNDMDLNTSKYDKKLTDTVTIQADVTDFEMKSTYTVATNQIFNEIDVDEVEDSDDFSDKIDELGDASQKLVDGSRKLENGTTELKNKFSLYTDAIQKAKGGAVKLKAGAGTLKNGIDKYTGGADKLLKGVMTYVEGTQKLSNGVKNYTAGASQLVDAVGQLRLGTKELPTQYEQLGNGIDTFVASVDKLLAKETMDQLSGGATELKNGIGKLDDGLKATSAGISKLNAAAGQLKKTDQLDQCVAGLQALVTQYETVASTEGVDAAQKAQATQAAAALKGAIAYIQGGEQAAAALDVATNGKADGEADGNGAQDLALAMAQLQAATDQTATGKNLYTGAASLESGLGTMSGYATQLRESSKSLTDGNAKMKSGISQVTDSIGKLGDGADKLVQNNDTLNQGADKLIKNGTKITRNSKKLRKNSKKLRKGADTLHQGIGTLFSGMTKLIDATGRVSGGISKLGDGAGVLANGVSRFHQDGVVRITDAVSELVDGGEEFNNRLSKISDLAENYTSFSGKSDQMEGTVKFVMATEGISKDDE